jgi:4-hydroxybenzoyl-CoA thioesterase
MIRFERTVKFEEVDAAGIVFFARYLGYCHEAMENFFGGLEGGYVRLIRDRGIGLPAVEANIQYTAPLRYGDAFTIDTTIEHIGNTSCTLAYRIWRKDGDRAVECTKVKHTCVVSRLATMTKLTIPDDMRALMQAHRSPATP